MTYLYFDNILLNGFRSGPLSPSAGTPPVALLGRQAILGQAKSPRPASNVDAPKGALSLLDCAA
jgi:hypothetical protein